MEKPVVLVLDVDGVLVDIGRGGNGVWLDESAARLGIDPAEIRLFFRSAWQEVIVGEALLGEALTAYFVTNGISADAEVFIRDWLETDFVLNEAVVALATHWSNQGIPLFLGTNQEHTRATFLRDRLPLPLVDVLYSADLGVGKPNDQFFKRAQARVYLHQPDARIVFVDDAETNVYAARSHGWTAIHYAGQPTFADELEAAISGSGQTTPG